MPDLIQEDDSCYAEVMRIRAVAVTAAETYLAVIASRRQVQVATDALETAQRPLILAGRGAVIAAMVAQLNKVFARELSARDGLANAVRDAQQELDTAWSQVGGAK